MPSDEHSGSNPYEPNPALRVLNRWFFDKIQVDEDWVLQVRELSRRGTVVYILRSLNLLDYLALDHLTKRFDLPRIRYVNDLHMGLFGPSGGGLLRTVATLVRGNQGNQLQAALQNGSSAALFLKRPPGVIDVASGASGGRGLKEGDEHVRTLINLQRGRSKPILLVPQVFVWTNRPDTQGTEWLDLVLGPREWASPLRTLGQFLYNYRHVELRAGDPLDLARYLETQPSCSEDVHVRRVIYSMLRRLERERRVVTGPAQQRPDRQRLQVLRSPKLQSAIAHMAGERAENRTALTRRALKQLKEMQATPDSATLKALEVLLERVFNRIYAGIEIDMEGMQRLRELHRDGSLVLLPSHKSYVDFMILSFIFYQHNLQLPMIVAGDNLSFFPFGPIARRAGAFFIRRTFRGDKLYSAVVEAYVRRLIRDGYALELFLEGGRSRTGKLLEPKLGMLGMIVEAALSLPRRQIHFVPISIGYERIIETGSYEEEMTGGEKTKEDAAGLLKSTKVLRHRYGRIDVQFGHGLTLDQIRQELGIAPDVELTAAKRRAVVTRLANRSMDEINRVTAVTPGALTAMALLGDRRRGIAHEQLLERCQKLVTVLTEMNARITPQTASGGLLRAKAISESVQMFIEAELLEVYRPAEGLVGIERRRSRHSRGGQERPGTRSPRAETVAHYRVPEQKRLELDTSKNHIVHFFVERAMVALSVLNEPGPPVATSVVRERARSISKLFKHEFRFRADASFDEIFDDTVNAMANTGELRRTPEGLLDLGSSRDGWPSEVWLLTYAAILRNFVEGYRVAARGLQPLVRGPMSEKELIRRSLIAGDRMYLSSEIELREAVSKPLIANALVAFREEGYLRLREGRYALTESFESSEAVAAIEGRITDLCSGLQR
jgi:glycerol-3-phosphate O-acyltransferase